MKSALQRSKSTKCGSFKDESWHILRFLDLEFFQISSGFWKIYSEEKKKHKHPGEKGKFSLCKYIL